MVCFAVITEIENGGNHACSTLLVDPDGEKHVVGSTLIVDPDMDQKEYSDLFGIALQEHNKTTIDLTKRQLIMCQSPVFRLGEILILDGNDRSIPDGRKPSKWFVTCEYFPDVESAITRAKEVTDPAMKRKPSQEKDVQQNEDGGKD